jgi:hypothetical protein
LHILKIDSVGSIFFIPSPGNSVDASNSTVAALAKGVLDSFPEVAFEEFETPFILQHRLLRSQPLAGPQTSASSPQQPFNYHHLFRLTSLSQTTAFCFAQRAKAGSVIEIPNNELDSHTSFLINQMGALWALRFMLQVQSGRTFSVGDYDVQIGAVTLLRTNPASAAAAPPPVSPGVVVAITRTAEEDDEEGTEETDADGLTADDRREALENARFTIRAFFKTVLANAKLANPIPQSDIAEEFTDKIFDNKEIEILPQKQDVVRAWCRLLRLCR